jgi:peptide deformylase
MDKSNIISLPDSHLRQKSKKVTTIDDDINKLIDDMKAATLDWEDSRQYEVGVALAAVQVDKLLRIIVVRSDFDNKQNKTFTVFINPEILKYEGNIEQDFEGCLSVPDIYGLVSRYSKIKVKAQDQQGNYFRLTAKGFQARVLQHEIDHINGEVFIDHIKDNTTAFFKLGEDGHLDQLNYEKDIRNNSILW